ncbi:N-acetylmuramoyl-L-alanine amidase AmiC precursor [Kingella potus]|uniref:N-acetylmuramoyl-L-alanine amidase AmiC n=1 Tax=Kingella potus TaxID=265175 RepID=A0A377QZQ3_9NEIS|nr:N-acetylmuramoyl-L-alanine amidase [Kingella potus]STR00220.1 N-acetylmuramoyl-L-alanine amidase AmiC precursor [Kingella potus]
MDKKYTRRQIVRSATAGLLFTVTPAALAKAPPQFVAVRIWPASAYSRITIETSDKLQYNYFTLDHPRRLVIDIKGVQLNSVLQEINSKVQRSDPYIGIIRVGQNTADTVRIVIDLKAEVNPQLFTLAPVAGFKHRLVADLYPMHADDANDPLMALLEDYSRGKISSRGTGADTPPVRRPPEPPRAGSNPPPAAPDRRHSRQPIIVLDPGHGGEDPGAIGKSGLREKDVVLSIARETKKRMEGLGYKVFMTRNEDVFIPLGVRVAKARRLRADLFISIHADAFTSPSARGTGVYTLSTRGASSAAAKFLAQTQNNADAVGGVKTGGNKDVDSTILDMTQTVTGKDSAMLGKKVLAELGRYNKLHKGDLDQANFAVLRAPDIPSILVETAFLSNPEEERKLSGMTFRRQCADAITAGVKSYLSTAILARR